jgi:hypothetical protein
MIGCDVYQKAQMESCTCVKEDKVTDAIRERLVAFLKANDAPAKDLESKKIDQLLKKYEDKAPVMFQKLLLKYPKALTTDTNKKQFMDEIFAEPAGFQSQEIPNRKAKFGVGLNEKEDENDVEEEEEAAELEDETTVAAVAASKEEL